MTPKRTAGLSNAGYARFRVLGDDAPLPGRKGFGRQGPSPDFVGLKTRNWPEDFLRGYSGAEEIAPGRIALAGFGLDGDATAMEYCGTTCRARFLQPVCMCASAPQCSGGSRSVAWFIRRMFAP